MRADTAILSATGRSPFQMAQSSGSQAIQDLMTAHTEAARRRSPRTDEDS